MLDKHRAEMYLEWWYEYNLINGLKKLFIFNIVESKTLKSKPLNSNLSTVGLDTATSVHEYFSSNLKACAVSNYKLFPLNNVT